MEPVVREVLRRAEIAIQQGGQPLSTWPEPQLERLCSFTPADSQVVEFITQQEYGLIRYRPGAVDPGRFIAQVALCWPSMKIAVVARRQNEVREVAKGLRYYGVNVSAVTGKSKPGKVATVVVTTPVGLGSNAVYDVPEHAPFDVSWLDIVFVLDALEATTKEPMGCLSAAVRARRYGFSPIGEKGSPLERDHVTVLFGFAELTVPAHGASRASRGGYRHSHQGGNAIAEDAGWIEAEAAGHLAPCSSQSSDRQGSQGDPRGQPG